MAQAADPDINKYHLTTRVDIYKTHFDLFVKGVALYLGIIGATAGLIFQPSANRTTRTAMALFIALCSAIGIEGSRIGIAWTRDEESAMDKICHGLGISHLSLVPARRIATLALILTSCLLVISVGAAVWFLWGK